jgi:outer membrane murein-binding lipoprotein Lpp
MKLLKIATVIVALLGTCGLSGCIAIEARKEADVQGLMQRVEALEQTIVKQQAEIARLQGEAARPAEPQASGQKP